MPAKQKIPTPLDYVHFLAGLPAPIEEEDSNIMAIPVPSPMFLPHPETMNPERIPYMGNDGPGQGGPILPPPIAPPAPNPYTG